MQNEKVDENVRSSTSSKQSQCSDISSGNDVETIHSEKTNSTNNNKPESRQSTASNKIEAIPQSKKLELLRRFRGITKSKSDNSEQKSVALTDNSNGKSAVATIESEEHPPIVAKKSQPVVPSPIQLNEHSG